jgi:hypothetical protein
MGLHDNGDAAIQLQQGIWTLILNTQPQLARGVATFL